MGAKLPLKQMLLRTLMGALILSAVVGIYAFLFGNFGHTEEKILFTTMAISYFSVSLLACAAAFEKKYVPLLTTPGLAVGIIGFLIFVPGIWADWFDSEPFFKLTIIVCIFSFSFAQACLLSLANLEQKLRWVFNTALGSIFALALLVSYMIAFEAVDEWHFRFIGILGILDGCATVTISVLYKLGTSPAEQFVTGPFQHIEMCCPRCGERRTFPAGEIVCPNCSLKIRIELMPDQSEST
jgi:hypothetical protein